MKGSLEFECQGFKKPFILWNKVFKMKTIDTFLRSIIWVQLLFRTWKFSYDSSSLT